LSRKTAFITGSKVYLRPLERADLNEQYLGWVNDAEIARYLDTRTFPTSMPDLVAFYEEVTRTRDNVILAIVDKKSDQHIGNVKLGPIRWVHRRATLGLLIGEKKFWGQGIGTEVTRLAVEYGFNRLNLRRIDLGLYGDHQSAVRCYEKVGFKVEGRLREHLFHEGEYKDSLLMGLLKSDYKPEKKRK
jgi:ribosomal-protein-alanine N-acetyltransferase